LQSPSATLPHTPKEIDSIDDSSMVKQKTCSYPEVVCKIVSYIKYLSLVLQLVEALGLAPTFASPDS